VENMPDTIMQRSPITLIIGLLALVWSLWEFFRAGIKVIKLGWNGWLDILLASLAKYRKPVDVSYQMIPAPPITQKNITALNAIGFRRLGEIQVKAAFRAPITAWILTHLDTKIQASAGWKRVEFATYFDKKTLVVTDYPNGEHIDSQHYQSHTIVTNLKDAYNYHQQQVEKFTHRFGQPHPIHSMTDYLHWEMVGRKYYATRKLRRWIWSNMVQLLAFLYGLLVLILAPLFFYPRELPGLTRISFFPAQESLIYLIVFLLLPVFFIVRQYNRWTVRQTYQDSRVNRRK
jgi:hypothetical protein